MQVHAGIENICITQFWYIHAYMNECVENSIHEYLEPHLLNEETLLLNQ